MAIDTRTRGAPFFVSGAITLILLSTIATVFAGTAESPSIYTTKERSSGISLPICLIIEPFGPHVHNDFAVSKELPKLPSFECDY
jgi:hypothetical protein